MFNAKKNIELISDVNGMMNGSYGIEFLKLMKIDFMALHQLVHWE